MTWIIVLILIGGTIAIIVKRSRKKTVTPLKKEKPNVEVKSEPAKETQKAEKPKTKRSVLGILNRIAITIVIIVGAGWLLVKMALGIYGTGYDIKNYAEKTYNDANVTLGVVKSYSEPNVGIGNNQIPLGAGYGMTYYLPNYCGFRFSGANVNYQVIVLNKNGSIIGGPYYAKAGKDASWSITGHRDMRLRFMSSSGKHGALTLEIWPK